MLHLRKRFVHFSFPHLAAVAATTAILSSRHRCLFYTTRFATADAAAASPNPARFAVEEYLVASCYLKPAQAAKVARLISHLKSPSKPDAVLAFLSGGVGLSNADVAAVVVRDPPFLCSKVDKTLAPRLRQLRDLGLSLPQIARLVVLRPSCFRGANIVPRLQYYLRIFGSFENLLKVHKRNLFLLSSDLENAKRNVALLQECGLGACDIAKLCMCVNRIITTNPERVQVMVECAKDIGVHCRTPMFRHALAAVAFLSKEKITTKVEFLKRTFRWSDAEARNAIYKLPVVLRYSDDRLRRMSEFLISEVGLEPEYIACRPAMISLGLEGRHMPRYYVLKFLKANGLLEHDVSYSAAVKMNEELFLKRYICPHMEAAPRLADDYAAACRGEAPTGFILQES